MAGRKSDFPITNGTSATIWRDLHPDSRADYVLANPPFKDSDWFRKDDDDHLAPP
jgi:type I restriction enzyme M protein